MTTVDGRERDFHVCTLGLGSIATTTSTISTPKQQTWTFAGDENNDDDG